MDGNSFSLDMFLERLRRDLPTIAEASPSARHTPAERRRLANGLIDVLCKWRVSFYDRYYQEDGPTYAPAIRRLKASEVWPVHSLWCGATQADLNRRLRVTEEIMASWTLEEAAPEVVVEELHTAAELMLMHLLGKGRAPTFVELVEGACSQGHLGGSNWLAQELLDPQRPNSMTDLLISLKDCRKNAKHKGSAGARAWLESNFWDAGRTLEYLSTRILQASGD